MRFKLEIITLFILLFVACGDDEKDKNSNQTPTIQTPIEPSLSESLERTFLLNFDENKTLNIKKVGKNYQIGETGKFIFVFFTPDCPACDVQNQILDEIAKSDDYKDKIKVVGVFLDANLTAVGAKAYAQNIHINFPISTGTENEYFLKTLGGIEKIPYMIFVDDNGEIKNDYTGLIPQEILINEIERIF